MDPEIRVTDDGTYELGATVDGVFVPFVSHPGSWVDGIVAAGKNAETSSTDAGTDGGTQHA